MLVVALSVIERRLSGWGLSQRERDVVKTEKDFFRRTNAELRRS
jgi:hypothetical protein